MARWLQELSLYDLDVVHRKGKTHANEDLVKYVDATQRNLTPSKKLMNWNNVFPKIIMKNRNLR